MNSKLFVVTATLFAVLFIQQAACEGVEVVEQPANLYILNAGSAFPYFVTDPNSPILSSDSPQVRSSCVNSQCQVLCKTFGYKGGRCNIGLCKCSN